MSLPSSQTIATHEAVLPFRRVLAATALDEPGAAAAVRAARLPLASGARLTLLHVVPRWSARGRRATGDPVSALRALAHRVHDAAASSGNAGVEIVPRVAEGWPALEMVGAARETGAELLVVGPPATRIDRSTRRTIFRALRRAAIPLLVVRNDPWTDHHRILCGVDGTPRSADAITLAVRLGRAARDRPELLLFHAWQAAFEEWTSGVAPPLREQALARVRGLAHATSQIASVRAAVRKGEFCAEMLRAARDEHADLIVLGTRDRSGLLEALLGSAAEWVVANSPWDVAIAFPRALGVDEGSSSSRRS